MSNLKRMKIMKKLFYSVLALAGILAVSCNKESEAPVAAERTGNTHTVTLKAAFAQEGDTRTTYANDKTFSWVEGDKVYVRCYNEAEEELDWFTFVAETSGPETMLTGEVDDGFELGDVAVYAPSYRHVYTWVYNGSTASIVAPISYHLDGFGLGEGSDGDATPFWNSVSVPSDNPLSVLPLVSVTKDDVLYFQTAMGVLNLNLTDVSAEATHVVIASGDGKYLGNYLMIKDGMVTMDDPLIDEDDEDGPAVYASSYMEYFFQPASDGTVSLMIPLPVGTLSAGSTIAVCDENDAILFAQTVRKDIVIERNKITKLVPLAAVASWEKLGTGKFVDNYLWQDMGADYDTYVDVEIEKSKSQDGYYRIVNPYGAAAKAFNYEAPHKVVGPQDIIFHILKVGDAIYGSPVTLADQIYWDEVYSGIDADDEYADESIDVDDLEYVVHHPGDYVLFSDEENWGRNLVAKYGADGTPANVIMAPIYVWGADSYWTGSAGYHEYNDVIQIIFPGVTSPVDLNSGVAFLEVTDDTPAQAIANVGISLGYDIAFAKVVIATDMASAKAAIAAGENVTVVTESGECEVKLPANAPSGDYQVFALTQVKEGLTEMANQYIYSDPFKYFNANDDLGYTLDDVIGTYTSEKMYFAYYRLNKWNWTDGDDTVTIVIEESDDEFLGNVMITSVLASGNRGFELKADTEYPGMYGRFNTATGQLVFEGVQPMNNTQFTADNNPCAFTGMRDDEGIEFFLPKPGTLTTDRCFLASVTDGEVDGYYRIIGGYAAGTYDYTYTRSTATSAPASVRQAGRSNYVEKCPDVEQALPLGKESKRMPAGVLR